MNSYRLDRTAFKAQTAEEASKSHAAYYKNANLAGTFTHS
jgi:hypothetical protein